MKGFLFINSWVVARTHSHRPASRRGWLTSAMRTANVLALPVYQRNAESGLPTLCFPLAVSRELLWSWYGGALLSTLSLSQPLFVVDTEPGV